MDHLLPPLPKMDRESGDLPIQVYDDRLSILELLRSRNGSDALPAKVEERPPDVVCRDGEAPFFTATGAFEDLDLFFTEEKGASRRRR